MPYPTQWAGNDPHKFMCCTCFAILDISDCAIDESYSQKIDVCVPCQQHEEMEISRRAAMKSGGPDTSNS